MPTHVLSFHSGYGCRNRGRCCSSHWPIALTSDERIPIAQALASGTLVPAQCACAPLLPPDAPPAATVLLASHDGTCVFHDADVRGGCRIHRALGHEALPLECRQFPRHIVIDPRGVSITLSHYCPTACDLLTREDAPAADIISNAQGFPEDAEYAGFSADPSLPPLLHPRLAMDWESWWLFERLSVDLLAGATTPLASLAAAVETTRTWTVGRGPLADHVRRAFAQARTTTGATALPDSLRQARRADALWAVPADWRETAADALTSAGATPVPDAATRRYLAAHAFASWAAYMGEGLRTWFRAVETAASLLELTADPGRADLVLRHLADSRTLVDRWGRAEREPATAPYSSPMNG